MYIPSKFKCQLSFKWHLNLIKVFATQPWTWYKFRAGVLDTILCDQFCQWLAAGWWYSLDIPVSSTNKTEILLNVTLSTHNLNTDWCLMGNLIKNIISHSSIFTDMSLHERSEDIILRVTCQWPYLMNI